MLQKEITIKREKGRGVFNLIKKMHYEQSVGEDETLAAMLQLKRAKDLKKGDRLVLSSAIKPEENLDNVASFNIQAAALIPTEGSNSGRYDRTDRV